MHWEVNKLNNYELNKLLVKMYPNLSEKYKDEVDWQEGDYTGSHTVYGDVFTPYLISCIAKNESVEIRKAFMYVETLLETENLYVEEVIAFSVLESILYLFKEKKELYDLLGKKTKKIVKELLDIYQ